MNKPTYQIGDRNFVCPICNGYGSITDDQNEFCDYCDGYGRVCEKVFNQLTTPITEIFDDDYE